MLWKYRWVPVCLFAIPMAIMGMPSDPAQLDRLRKSQPVVTTESVPGKPWPRVTVYRTLPLPALDAFAIFSDVEAQRHYVNHIVESRITKKVDERSFMVLFVQEMPWPLPREVFTMLNRLEYQEKAFAIHWQLLSATSTRDASGFAKFDPFDGKTLMTYQTWVDPGYDIARSSFFGKMAVKEVEDASQKIEAFILQTSQTKPQVVAKLKVGALKALGLPLDGSSRL